MAARHVETKWVYGTDKLEHFGVGAAIAIVGTLVSSPWYALAAVVVAAIGKETYDYFHPDTHDCDIWDAISTTVGGIVGALIAVIA